VNITEGDTMVVKVGLIGLGFMGKMHFETYRKIPGARVTALCDGDPRKRAGDWSAVSANIGSGGGRYDLSGYRVHADAADLIADPDVDVVDITLPTYLHAGVALRALEAGKHVICEKPMARTGADALKMAAAAKAARRKLFIGQCIRYWPAYAVARRIIQGGALGRVQSAAFRRLAATPLGSWRNWLQDPALSGLCALDLHIHDADFVLYTFGRPKAVTSRGAGFSRGRLDHIATTYEYGDGALVTAEGSWMYAPPFGFEMTFLVALERATLALGRDGALRLLPKRGQPRTLKVPAGDGYLLELRDFIGCLARGKDSEVVTPASAAASVRLVEAEVESALRGRTVPVRA
jgi:predicted dehydrogenase